MEKEKKEMGLGWELVSGGCGGSIKPRTKKEAEVDK